MKHSYKACKFRHILPGLCHHPEFADDKPTNNRFEFRILTSSPDTLSTNSEDSDQISDVLSTPSIDSTASCFGEETEEDTVITRDHKSTSSGGISALLSVFQQVPGSHRRHHRSSPPSPSTPSPQLNPSPSKAYQDTLDECYSHGKYECQWWEPCMNISWEQEFQPVYISVPLSPMDSEYGCGIAMRAMPSPGFIIGEVEE